MQLAVRRTHLALHDVQIHPDAARRLARIQVTLRTIANLGDERRHSLHRAHLPVAYVVSNRPIAASITKSYNGFACSISERTA